MSDQTVKVQIAVVDFIDGRFVPKGSQPSSSGSSASSGSTSGTSNSSGSGTTSS